MFTDNKFKLIEATEKEPFYNVVYKKELSENEYAIIYIKKGKGKFLFDKKASAIQAGSFIMLYGGDTLTCVFSNKYPTKVICLLFECNNTILKRGIYRCFNTALAENALGELIDEFILRQKNCGKGLSIKLQNSLYALFDSLKKKSDVDTVIENLAKDINKNFLKKIDVDEYAKKVNLSKDRLSVIFRERFGLPPYKYQTMLKMNLAKELLLYTDLSIAEIAELLGYKNQLYFSTAYKNQSGVAPSKVRKLKL